MNELTPRFNHQRQDSTLSVLSVDVPTQTETADSKTEDLGSATIRRSLESMAISSLPRNDVTHRVVERADIMFKLQKGFFDDPVKAYLKSKGWTDRDLLDIEVEWSVEVNQSDYNEFLCKRLLNEAIEKKSLDVFKVIPKTAAQIPDLLVKLNVKIKADPDCEIYRQMRDAAVATKVPNQLDHLLGN